QPAHTKNKLYTKKNENQKNHETENNNRTYLDIVKTAIQQTNQPTPALTLSINTDIKLSALVIESHIANLAKIESYRSILSKSLKRNFNIDTSFPDRDSQKIPPLHQHAKSRSRHSARPHHHGHNLHPTTHQLHQLHRHAHTTQTENSYLPPSTYERTAPYTWLQLHKHERKANSLTHK
ncbi:hypothetical protein FHG87_024299, partial [Trinorchestia longiramus]